MYNGKCQGCDSYGEVDDINLCVVCAWKLEKQMRKEEREAKKNKNKKVK